MDKVANGSRLKGGNLVNIRTGSTVHWGLAFIAMGTMQGCERSKGMSKSETGLRSLGQGSRERVWNGEGRAGSGIRSPDNGIKVCG